MLFVFSFLLVNAVTASVVVLTVTRLTKTNPKTHIRLNQSITSLLIVCHSKGRASEFLTVLILF